MDNGKSTASDVSIPPLLVRDEGVVGSNPITPTNHSGGFPETPSASPTGSPARYVWELGFETRRYFIFDRLRGSTDEQRIAVCYRFDDAERICAALNGAAS